MKENITNIETNLAILKEDIFPSIAQQLYCDTRHNEEVRKILMKQSQFQMYPKMDRRDFLLWHCTNHFLLSPHNRKLKNRYNSKDAVNSSKRQLHIIEKIPNTC